MYHLRIPTLATSYLLFSPSLQVDCDAQNFLQYSNATDNVTIENPFVPKEGPWNKNISSRWTWQLDTQSPVHMANGSTSLRQSLSLSVNPPPSPGLLKQEEYTGCGLILHGVKFDKIAKSQGSLNGDCTGFISEECREAILVEAAFKAKYLNVKKKEKHENKHDSEPARDVCQGLAVLRSNRTLTKCENDFSPGAWYETFVWASSTLNSSQCTDGTSSFTVHTWGASTYNSTNIRAYNNLTTSIDPIITTLHMASRDSVAWSAAHIMCLRSGKHINSGSSHPQEVPKDLASTASASISRWSLVRSSSALAGLFLFISM